MPESAPNQDAADPKPEGEAKAKPKAKRAKAPAKKAAKAKSGEGEATSSSKAKGATKGKGASKGKSRGAKGASSAKGKTLVIVESPAKAKTINKYLGDKYIVEASYGHIRDLPRKEIGIDVKQQFEPTYEVLGDKRDLVTRLRKLAKSADQVCYACDPDREGEAIAWHLSQALDSKKPSMRVTFNEITKSAIERAFQQPREIDMNKVNAQQARRILDRIVGYKLSPLLWRKVKTGLSAGRVQSVAVKILSEKEKAIRAFVPVEYWRITGQFQPEGQVGEDTRFGGEIHSLGGTKVDPKDFFIDGEARANAVLARITDQPATITRNDTNIKADRPHPPFITSTLQQAASTKLRFSTKRTMLLAQQLYEGIDLQGERVGLITYMRTDSFNLANESVDAARSFILEHFGEEYLPESKNVYKTKKKSAQEAHEAIRPTRPDLSPERVARHLDQDQLKLYKLIWERFIGCQMTDAQYAHKTIEVTIEPKESAALASTVEGPNGEDERFDGAVTFRTTGKTLVFDGHAKVTGLKLKASEPLLPVLADDQALDVESLIPSQHFTQPPPRYTEASLVKKLEEEGIGRPSTYSAIVSTIQQRGYVRQESRKLFCTPLGEIVTDKLQSHFEGIMDTQFTSRMEQQLDEIEDKNEDWITLLDRFYGPFVESLKTARESMKGLNEDPPKAEEPCEKCGSDMVYMYNKRDLSRFLGCSNYPDCRNTKPLEGEGGEGEGEQGPELENEVHCDDCGAAMQLRKSRYGYFLGCSAYPKCKSKMSVKVEDGKAIPVKAGDRQQIKADVKCTECGSDMIVRFSRRRGRGAFLGCSGYPKCRATQRMPKDIDPNTGAKTEEAATSADG